MLDQSRGRLEGSGGGNAPDSISTARSWPPPARANAAIFWDGMDGLAGRYREVRRQTEQLCEPLAAEDYLVQSMPDASPAKWHLAHTTWFFETFVLGRARRLPPFDPRSRTCSTPTTRRSGPRHRAAARGLLSRPTVDEVYALPRARSTTAMLGSLDDAALGRRRARAASSSGCTTSSSTRS